MQFLGEFEHTIDAKGRVILPAKFRDQLEEGAVIAKTREGCLAVYPPDEWEQVATRNRELMRQGIEERAVARSLFAGATEVSPDRQGRVPIPQNLREYADLDKDVVVTGAFTHIEIWNAAQWADQVEAADSALRADEGRPEMGM